MKTKPRATLRTAILMIALLGGGALNACGTADMNDSDSGALDDLASAVPDEVLAMAQSSDPAILDALAEQLQNEAFLHAWDHPDDYAELDPRSLALAGVLSALAGNPAPEAQRVLEDLTTSPLYAENDARVLLLIEALGKLRSVSKASVDYWQRHTGPGSIFNGIVFSAVSGQGSAEAAAVAGAILKDDGIGDHEKIAWLRRSVVANRNQEGVLAEAEVLLDGAELTEPVRMALVETLFDYRPDEWYAPDTVVSPPGDDDYSADARAIRARLARTLLDEMSFESDLEKALEAAGK